MRTLYESAGYARCCAEIEPNAARLDEALRYALYVIARNPDTFPVIPGTKLRRVRTNDFPGAPALLLYFTINDADCCTLQWLELLPTTPEIQGTV